MKLKLQPSPYRSLRRTLLWGEKAGTSLGLSIAGSRYAVYESHVGEHVPLERICRGPDGRFVVETEAQESGRGALEPFTPRDPQPYVQPPAEEEPVWHKGVSLRPRPAGQPHRDARYRRGRYFGYGSSSSPVDEAAALCIVDISPVASAATLPYSTTEELRGNPGSAGPCQRPASTLWDSLPLEGSPRTPPAPTSPPVQSGILQYLSLPFFKEMCVDGDWPEEPAEPPDTITQPKPTASPPPGSGGSPQRAGRTLCPDCIDTCANATSPPATAFLRPPSPPVGPAKASLPGTAAWPGSPSPQPPASGRTEPAPSAGTAEPPPPEKLPRGSLTSQSSGRGSASFLRPPSLAPSLGGTGGSVAEEGRARMDPALGGKR